MEENLKIRLLSLTAAKSALFLISICFTNTLLGQEKKDLTISISSGILSTPHYRDAHAREFYGIDFAYQLGERHVISADYLTGGHHYFDNKLSNVQGINIQTELMHKQNIEPLLQYIDTKSLSGQHLVLFQVLVPE